MRRDAGWLPALAVAGFRAVAPDLRGYHFSEKPPGSKPWRIETVAADLRVERIPGSGHWVQHEAPERVNALLLDFLRAV